MRETEMRTGQHSTPANINLHTCILQVSDCNHQGCVAGAGVAGADAFCKEQEPLEHFAQSRSRKKRGSSGSERNVNMNKICKREMKALYLVYS